VFNTLEGRSSYASVATVAADNARRVVSMQPQATRIDVRQVAQAQANEGDVLAAAGGAVGSGSFSFEIEAGGRTHTFNINVTGSDDNSSIHRRMAEAINSSDIGVRATVETARTDGTNTTQLNLTASQTGTNSTFTVRDVAGNLTEEMGVTSTSQDARNAIFSLNGGFERHSQSNNVSLATGVTATLQGEGRTDISFGHNVTEAVRGVTDLVNALNSALRNTNAGDGRGSERFISDIQGMNRIFASQLSRVGIDVQNDGQLSINQDRLQRAAADGSLGRLFENNNSGFSARVSRIANNAASSNFYRNTPAPVNFTSPNTGFNFGNVGNSWSFLNMFG